MPIPAGPGFYWAIWLTEIRGLKQTGERSDDWEVVWVFENSTDPGEKRGFLFLLFLFRIILLLRPGGGGGEPTGRAEGVSEGKNRQKTQEHERATHC